MLHQKVIAHLNLVRYYSRVTPESARWLIMSGKEEEAKTLLSRMAKVNGRKVNVDDIFEDKVDLTVN